MQLDSDDFVLVDYEDAGLAPPGQPDDNAAAELDAAPKYLADISDFLDGIADELWAVNKKIHDNPELGFKEYMAHATLTSFMRARGGWTVTPSAYGMETAWVAVWDSRKKGPVISFNAEMDALQGMGHACGHNLIAIASVAGALATAEVMERHDLAGKVVLFGTPAEEGGGGKIKLLERGAFRDHQVDVSLISHPGTIPDHALMSTTAYQSLRVAYRGRESHAAANPWLGINALDALVTAYNALSVLRQQTMPGDVIQGHITDGGLRPNVIHAHAAGTFVARARTQARLDALLAKVTACFEAGAVATGATLDLRRGTAYKDHAPNRALGAAYTRRFNALAPPAGPIPTDPELDALRGLSGASTDQGDVSHALPSLSPGFAIPPGPEGNGPHSPDFALASGTREAFSRALRVAKALAGVAVDVLTVEGLLGRVKREWEENFKGKEAGSALSV